MVDKQSRQRRRLASSNESQLTQEGNSVNDGGATLLLWHQRMIAPSQILSTSGRAFSRSNE